MRQMPSKTMDANVTADYFKTYHAGPGRPAAMTRIQAP